MSTTFNNGLYTPDTPVAVTSLAPVPSSTPLPPSSSVIQPTVLPSTSLAEITPPSSSVAPVAAASTTSLASTTPPASSTLSSVASVPTTPPTPSRTIAGTVFTYATTPPSRLSSTTVSSASASTATSLPSTEKSGIDIKTLTPVFVVIPLILLALVLGFTYNRCWGGAGFKRKDRRSKGDSWGDSGLDGNGYRGVFNDEKGLVKGRWLGEEKEFMRNREEGAEERNALAGAFPPIRKVTALSRFKGLFSRGGREDDKEFMAVPYTPLETPFMNPSDSTGDILRKAYLHPERDDEEEYPHSGGGGARSGYGREEERGWAWGTNQQRQSQPGDDNRYPTAPMVGGRNLGDSPQKAGLRGPRSQGLAVDGWKKYRPKSTASISSLRSSTMGSINSLINSLGAGAGGLRKKRAPGGIDENGKFTALLTDHDVDDESSYSPARKTTLTRVKSKLLPAVDPGMSPSIYSPATTFTNEHGSPSLTNDNGSITGTSIATEDYDSLASRRQRDYELNQYLGQSRVGNNDLAGRFLNGDLTPEEEEISRFDSRVRKEAYRDEEIEVEEVVESHGFRMEEEEVLPRPGRTYVSPKKGSTVRAGGRETPYTPTKPALLFCYDSPPSQSRIKNRPLASPLKVSSRPSPSTHQRTQSTTSSMRSPGGALPPHQVEQIRNSESMLGLNGGLRGLIFGSGSNLDLANHEDEEKMLGGSDSTSTLTSPTKKLEEIPPVVESLNRKPSKALPASPTPSSPPPTLPSFARPISHPRSISSSTQATIPSARTPTKSNPTTPTRQSAASRVRQAINELETKSFNEAPLSPSTNRSVKKVTPSHGFIGARPMYSNSSSYQTQSAVSEDEEEDEESIRPVAPLRYTRPISTPPPSRNDRIPTSASPYRSSVPNPMMMGSRSKSSNTLYQQYQTAAVSGGAGGGRLGGARAMSNVAQARTVETGKLASPVRVKVPGNGGGFPTHKKT